MYRPFYDTIIVGGGPVGSYAAFLLRGMGFDLCVIEEHPTIGRPVQCAGLVNSGIASLPGMDQLIKSSILNNISGADLFSPNGTKLELRSRSVKAFSIDRAHFDNSIVRAALDRGTDLMLGCRVTGISGNGNGWVVGTDGIDGRSEVRSGSVILCDGSDHGLRRRMGLDVPKEIVPGISCEVQASPASYDDSNVGVFTGRDIAPGFFAWAIPAGPVGRLKLGLCSSVGGDLRPRLSRFLSYEVLRSWIEPTNGKAEIGEVSLTFGTVPIGPVEPFQRSGILLLGDSAGMAKPTSGGGIFPGLIAAESLSKSVRSGDGGIDDVAFKRFSRSWKQGYARELKKSMMLRGMIKEVEDHEIDLSLTRLRDSPVMDFVNEKGDIDRPFTLAAGVFARDPSLAGLIPRFLPKILKAMTT